MLIRLLAITGTVTCRPNAAVAQLNAARGTEVTMVGTRDSCQPIPVLIIVTPAASISAASAVTSAKVCPPGTRSSSDIR